jgi:hypothetical protein
VSGAGEPREVLTFVDNLPSGGDSPRPPARRILMTVKGMAADAGGTSIARLPGGSS